MKKVIIAGAALASLLMVAIVAGVVALWSMLSQPIASSQIADRADKVVASTAELTEQARAQAEDWINPACRRELIQAFTVIQTFEMNWNLENALKSWHEVKAACLGTTPDPSSTQTPQGGKTV